MIFEDHASQYRTAMWTLHQASELGGPVFDSRWTLMFEHGSFLWQFFQKLLVIRDKKVQDGVHDDKVVRQVSIMRPSGEGTSSFPVSWDNMESTPNICVIYPCNSGHFTTSENEWNQGTRPNSCSQAFACWHQEVKTSRIVSKYSGSVEFYWYQNIVCWNMSHWYSRGTNLQNSRVQVHP